MKFKDGVMILSGGTPKTDVLEYWNGDIDWLTVADFGNCNKYVYSSEKKISQLGLDNSSTTLLKKGDIIISARGTVGSMAILNNSMAFNQSCFGLRAKKNYYNQDFLYYYLKYYIINLKKKSQGSVFATINLDTFNYIELPDISIEKQNKIAQILSSIDSKIEINNAINNNLEQIIKSCFDFMFATKEPNGIISDILQEHPKSSIKVNDSIGVFGDYPFFTSGESINEWHNALVDGMNCYLSTGGNATINGYYGKAAYSTDTWCVYGKGEYSFYLFSYLKSIIHSINKSFFAGSGLKHLQKDSLLLVNLYIPTIEELKNFNSIVKPAVEVKAKLFLETKKLKQQRDFLLPLLMNGQAVIED